jgi:hypothetical protein
MNKLNAKTTKTLHAILLGVAFVFIAISLIQMIQGQPVNMVLSWIVIVIIGIDILVVKVFGTKS